MNDHATAQPSAEAKSLAQIGTGMPAEMPSSFPRQSLAKTGIIPAGMPCSIPAAAAMESIVPKVFLDAPGLAFRTSALRSSLARPVRSGAIQPATSR